MRTPLAATAAVTAALVLAGCTAASTDETEADPEPTATTLRQAGDDADDLITCRGYFDGGDQSIHALVERWSGAVNRPATEQNDAWMRIIHSRIDAQYWYAQTGPAAVLRGIQEPFADSLSGQRGDADHVREAANSLALWCLDIGYPVPA